MKKWTVTRPEILWIHPGNPYEVAWCPATNCYPDRLYLTRTGITCRQRGGFDPQSGHPITLTTVTVPLYGFGVWCGAMTRRLDGTCTVFWAISAPHHQLVADLVQNVDLLPVQDTDGPYALASDLHHTRLRLIVEASAVLVYREAPDVFADAEDLMKHAADDWVCEGGLPVYSRSRGWDLRYLNGSEQSRVLPATVNPSTTTTKRRKRR